MKDTRETTYPCPRCRNGYVREPDKDGHDDMTPCPLCNGTAHVPETTAMETIHAFD